MNKSILELNFLIFELFIVFLENNLPNKYIEKKEFKDIKNLLELLRKETRKELNG